MEHEHAAFAARARAIAAADGSPEMSQAFDDELRAAMVAIAAAAFAVDALYATVTDMLDPSQRPALGQRASRPGQIVETLKVAIKTGKRTQGWQEAIPRLFALRDNLVHFAGEPVEPRPHPTGKAHVSRESSTFTAEAAAEAVDLALEVLSITYTSPRERHSALAAWSERARHIPTWLEGLRSGRA